MTQAQALHERSTVNDTQPLRKARKDAKRFRSAAHEEKA